MADDGSRPLSRERFQESAISGRTGSRSPGFADILSGLTDQFDRLFSHRDLADLARDCHRELVDDMDVPRNLVVRELAGAERADRIGVEIVCTFAHLDPHHQFLAVLYIGRASCRDRVVPYE